MRYFSFFLFFSLFFLANRARGMGEEEDDDAGISTPVSFILPATAAASDLIQDAIDEYDAKLIRFTHFFGKMQLA